MSERFSFIHAADLHLDSPFRGYEQIDDVDGYVKENILKQLRNCTFAALDNIVNACIRYKVDFLILAGDIYDLADRSIRAELRFRRAMEQLAEREISVFVTYGNHDHAQGIRSNLSWPENVHFFSQGEVEYREFIRKGKEIARVYGISYPRREVTENYALRFKRHPGAPFCIGVLHCNVGGVPGHENYAPCRLDDLIGIGMDYWALGHVHSRKILRDGFPWVVYPGNSQGRNPREHSAKGCYLVQVSGNIPTDLQFLPIDNVRWINVDISIDGLNSEEELLNTLINKLTTIKNENNSKSVITPIKLSGRGRLYNLLKNSTLIADLLGEIRLQFTSQSGAFLWPESIKNHTCIDLDKESLIKTQTFMGDLFGLIEEARSNEELRNILLQSIATLEQQVAIHMLSLDEQELDELLERAGELAFDLLWESNGA